MRQSEVITQQLKAIENSNIVHIQSVAIEHQKSTCKLSKAIRQAENVSK